ncbi:MAG: aspartate kinase [Acidobacteriota bacterium]|nr:MAG: aspartate kinase [Acidobacteriota bacterium]
MIVIKFGGTSVDGSQRLLAAARIVEERRGEGPVVVTSAMAGVTDTLTTLVTMAREGNKEGVNAGLLGLQQRHSAAAEAIAPDDPELARRLEERLRELRVLLRGVRLLGNATPRSIDAVLGFGELLAQELLHAALVRQGAQACVVDAREVIVTDDHFGAARPDPSATATAATRLVRGLVERGRIPVLGGYLGATPDGIPTTLGRGGSDLSASVLAVALRAETVEIWTDVNGLMTGDPRLVPGARLLEAVTFREAAELAGFGAKVLHPAAIDPAVRAGIPVIVRNALAPEVTGTRIGVVGPSASRARAVAQLGGLVLVCIRAPGRIRESGFLPGLLGVLERERLLPLLIAPGPEGVDLVFSGTERAPRVAEGLAKWGPVRTRSGLAVVAVVGEGLSRRVDLWAKVLETARGVRVQRLLQGPRGVSLGLLVREQDSPELARTLHREWVEKRRRDSVARV